jgi:gliding motility-associated-like protein
MRKIFLLIAAVFLCCTLVSARHIKGGWIQYEYMGVGATPATSIYKITVSVFRDCAQSGPMPSSLGFYDAVSFKSVQIIPGTIYTASPNTIKTYTDPCLSNYTAVCYQIHTYSTTVTLPDNSNGYIIAAQEANRVSNIKNITNSSSTGISFTATIPGTINGTDYHINTSPFFNFKDTVVVCYNAKFTYQFNASDADGDSLSYAFGNGINGVSNLVAPPYSALAYAAGYSGISPMGPSVSIDPETGLISGTAPSVTGEYVIAVYVSEWRKGEMINTTRKELQITVGNCSLSAASLKSVYLNCDTYGFTFQNESLASNINTYQWDFGVPAITTDTSSKPTPTYTYADTGTYTIKLVVSNTGGCKDSATAPVKVYPGFTPSFAVAGSCFQSPFQFTDNSFVKYGTVTSRFWNFGDTATTADTSIIKNPTYQYPSSGSVTVKFNITSSVGCSGSVTKTVTVNDKPYIFLPFTDTLICSIDTLPLLAQGNGVYKWSPNYRISDTSAIIPLVYPKDTTVYTLTVTDRGCIDSAKIKVNVLKFITVKLGLDSGICKADSFTLRPVSDALSYKWRESGTGNSMNSYAAKYPVVTPLVTTTYFVTANLGYCQDSAKVKINVSPYPVAQLGNDTAICFGSRIQLNSVFAGVYYTWSPTSSLINTNTLTPIAGPVKTTNYILTAKDTLYCKKEVSDTITVRVIPPFIINAGKDTSITIGQPLQLLVIGADSGYTYQWSPYVYLDNAGIYNPVATINSVTIDSIRYQVKATTPEGCFSTDDIWIRVYKNGPEIFVPSAFTPNGDGLNDVLKPMLVGISKFNYFTVYNRWGQVIYTTSERNVGWDGSFKGSKQAGGAYIYATQGEDYQGKTIFRKGTAVLIR